MSQVKRSVDAVLRRGWKALPDQVQSNIRPHINKKLVARSDAGPTLPADPLLSVIVPVHNVKPYLRSCLDSVLSQDYDRLEVIVVDDGSTDGSAEIAQEYSQHHKRVRFFQLPHSGNGVARNRGIAAANGEFLTFADSDDVVMPGAYSHMVNQLRSSGSDFVVGAFRRRKGNREWLPAMMNELHGSDRFKTQVDDFPEIMRDVFLWNKVFRKTFWDECIGEMPEGMLYEDQEPIARAYLRAASFDILARPVYVWRIREDNSSITQQKGDLTDLSDRMKAARIVTDLVLAEGKENTKRAWFVKSLGEDLRLYIDKIPNTGLEYWSVLQKTVGFLHDSSGADLLSALPLPDRILSYLIAEDRRADVESVLVAMRDEGRTFSAASSADGLTCASTYAKLPETPLPHWLIQVHESDVKINTRLLNVDWSSSGNVAVRAAAYLTGIDATRFDYETSVVFVNTTTGRCVAAETVAELDPRVDQVSGDRWNSYSGSAFTARISTAELLEFAEAPTPNGQEWALHVTVEAGGFTRTDVIRVRDTELLPFQLPVGRADGQRRLVGQIDRNQGLRLRVIRYGSMAQEAVIQGRTLEFKFKGDRAHLPGQVFLQNSAGKLSAARADDSDGRSFKVTLPAPPPDNEEATWDVLAKSADNKTHYVGWPETSTNVASLPSADGAVRISVTGYGYLRVSSRSWRVTVSGSSISPDGKVLTLTGRSAQMRVGGERALDLILATNRNIIKPLSVELIPGTEKFRADFPLAQDKWGYGEAFPETGHYRLLSRITASDGTVLRRRVHAVGDFMNELPLEFLNEQVRVVQTAEDRERSFVLKILAPYRLNERGSYAQQQLRDRYLTGQGVVDQEVVLLESFAGKSTTDSVKAIGHELGKRFPNCRLYWTVSDSSVPVPHDSTAVLIYSEEWYRLLNTAGTLVNNNNFPSYFKKRSGQFYLQTWHGTPLKKIGNHTPIENLSASYRRLMAREAAVWDALLVQNTYSERVLPEAFGYTGAVINEGYPRNDSLHNERSAARRIEIRRSLGLDDTSIVVLYMPTWRDNVRTAQGKFDTVNYLNFEKVREALGDRCVVLFRGHHNVAGQRNTAELSTFVDVTGYPEVADLYLAADVMITDYSSSMFDFCGTGKPILFLAPDIDEYRMTTRGFYFDFEAEAPGPILSTTEEAIVAITELDKIRKLYREAYEIFAERYSSKDDGTAAARVVKSLFL